MTIWSKGIQILLETRSMLARSWSPAGRCIRNPFPFDKYKILIHPFVRRRGIDTTKAERDQGLEELKIFGNWINTQVLAENELDAAPIMLIPLGRPGANYRDIVPPPGYL